MKGNLSLFIVLILLTVAAAVVYFTRGGSGTLSSNPLADFGIADTSTVTKIVIIDKDGNKVTLERDADSDLWDLNGKYKARKGNTDLLLKTFLRIKVKGPVPKSMQETVIRNIAGDGKKCEIYQEGKLSKTYYIGTPTPDHFGTYMLLETPEEGRSSEPFVMHMSGFAGFLSSRFFTDEEQWRYTGVFRYPELELSEVAVQDYENPMNSFMIEYNGGNDLKLMRLADGREIQKFDTLDVKNYLLLYKKVHFESFSSGLTPAEEDSVLNLPPAFSIKVTENSGENKQITLYWVANNIDGVDLNGVPFKWNPDYFYGTMDGDDLVLCQRFVFDPLLQPIRRFSPGMVE